MQCCIDCRPDSENVPDYMVHWYPQGSKPYCKLSKHCFHSFQPYKETFLVWTQYNKRNFSFPLPTPLKPKLNMSVIMKMSRLESSLCLLSEKRTWKCTVRVIKYVDREQTQSPPLLSSLFICVNSTFFKASSAAVCLRDKTCWPQSREIQHGLGIALCDH